MPKGIELLQYETTTYDGPAGEMKINDQYTSLFISWERLKEFLGRVCEMDDHAKFLNHPDTGFWKFALSECPAIAICAFDMFGMSTVETEVEKVLHLDRSTGIMWYRTGRTENCAENHCSHFLLLLRNTFARVLAWLPAGGEYVTTNNILRERLALLDNALTIIDNVVFSAEMDDCMCGISAMNIA